MCVNECGCCLSALCVLQCSEYLRGVSLAQQSHSKSLKKECADVLESLKVRVSQHFVSGSNALTVECSVCEHSTQQVSLWSKVDWYMFNQLN